MISNEQVSAAAAHAPDDVTTSAVRAAVETADAALHEGAAPVNAVSRAARVLFPDLMASAEEMGPGEAMMATKEAMNTTMQACLAADHVARLGPEGILPLGDGKMPVSPLAKLKAQRKAARGETREQVVSGLADRFTGAS